VPDTETARPTPAEVVQALKAVLPDFERAGVCLALENHDRFPADALAMILRQIDSERAGLCLDTANSIACLETAETLLEVLGSRVVNVHVKDYCISRLPHQKGFVVEGRPAGQGQLDIPGLLGALRSRGRNLSAIVELWPPPEPTIAASIAKEEVWARDSIRYLRRFIAG
jgi:sugar phosphate isomerase/epimerase